MSTPKTLAEQLQSKTTPVQDTPEIAALKAQIAAMQAEQDKLKAALAEKPTRLSLKVSEKGAVSVYGMGRWPVTLYAEQWGQLLSPETVKSIAEFIAANKGKLSTKADKQAAEQAEAEAERKARVAAYEASKAGAKVG